MWLAAVRNLKAPKQLGLERHDEILSIDVVRELAILKLTSGTRSSVPETRIEVCQFVHMIPGHREQTFRIIDPA